MLRLFDADPRSRMPGGASRLWVVVICAVVLAETALLMLMSSDTADPVDSAASAEVAQFAAAEEAVTPAEAASGAVEVEAASGAVEVAPAGVAVAPPAVPTTSSQLPGKSPPKPSPPTLKALTTITAVPVDSVAEAASDVYAVTPAEVAVPPVEFILFIGVRRGATTSISEAFGTHKCATSWNEFTFDGHHGFSQGLPHSERGCIEARPCDAVAGGCGGTRWKQRMSRGHYHYVDVMQEAWQGWCCGAPGTENCIHRNVQQVWCMRDGDQVP